MTKWTDVTVGDLAKFYGKLLLVTALYAIGITLALFLVTGLAGGFARP